MAGEQAKNEVAGDEEGGWMTRLKAAGFTPKTKVEGMGLNNAWADIYVDRLKALDAEYKKSGK